MTQYGGRYELLDSKGESGQPTLSITAPISRWGWFTYVNGDTASNGRPLETSEQAYEDLDETRRDMVFP